MTLKHYYYFKLCQVFSNGTSPLSFFSCLVAQVTLNSYTREADPLLFISVNSSVLRWPCLGVEEGREGRRDWDNKHQKWGGGDNKKNKTRSFWCFFVC